MLRQLRIKNLAVIEDVAVQFAPGLNVLTGETGAGKSIVVDAILLVLGARAQPDLIRSGDESAVVEAVFDIEDAGPAAAVLDEAGHRLEDGQLVIRRELSRSGRHRAYVNDSAATVGLLERLGEVLVELHGQHEHQRLMEPARQLDLLDRFAEALPLRERVAALVRQWGDARAALQRLRAEVAESARQEDLYRFQISEIDAVRLCAGEEDALRADRTRLQHAERILRTLEDVLAALHEDDDSASSRLSRSASLLAGLGRVDAQAGAPAEALEAALVQVDEVVGVVRALRDRAVADPDRLAEIESRLDAIAKLKRKYGETEAAILAYREEVAAALGRIESQDALFGEREAEAARLGDVAVAQAKELSETRSRAAQRLERSIQKEVRGLGMPECRIRMALPRERASASDLADEGGWRLTARGAEGAELLISANPGEEVRPLAKVVSGGELSRVMLAVKAILAAADETPTLVFDEVDAGIGGRVADIVGQRLGQAAPPPGPLVTHLAPIAAHAARHLVVEKHVARSARARPCSALDESSRAEELARMLGGERVTDASRRHARELLGRARTAQVRSE